MRINEIAMKIDMISIPNAMLILSHVWMWLHCKYVDKRMLRQEFLKYFKLTHVPETMSWQ